MMINTTTFSTSWPKFLGIHGLLRLKYIAKMAMQQSTLGLQEIAYPNRVCYHNRFVSSLCIHTIPNLSSAKRHFAPSP